MGRNDSTGWVGAVGFDLAYQVGLAEQGGLVFGHHHGGGQDEGAVGFLGHEVPGMFGSADAAKGGASTAVEFDELVSRHLGLGSRVGCLMYLILEQLANLQADPGRGQLYDRINDVLDQIEDDPAAALVRRHRYLQPPLWGVQVHGSGEDWLILWEESPNESLVHYIGVRL